MQILSSILLAAGLATSVLCLDTPVPSAQTGPAPSAVTPAAQCQRVGSANPSLFEKNREAAALLPPNCDLQACLNVGPVLTCIVKALQNGNLIDLAGCLTTGIQEPYH
ncbi:hypothetical protein N7539_007164 [Penicillium diatomitis]|uniref:Hydrophobin n=1 Tax=Penicillium diatomitis TaxID=2819901 RepID=A0A9X0BNM1_9EURO|nr:uncharacterized protein N7539_007164 [Penicillium diatomitis]KAJ5477020.1 hypothetical protein N7539_007164 [Penicillium diatomitis]